MKVFKDNTGRSWEVLITISTVKRIKGMIDIDILDVNKKGNIFDKVADDPVFLCDLLYVVCKPQADQLKVTDIQFGECMGGAAIEDGTIAFMEELTGFFPKAKRRALRKVLEKQEEANGIASEKAIQQMDSMDIAAKVDKVIAKAMAEES